MTAKKAQISTMILLVVPLGFSTGTELLKTMAHKSHTDFPIVKVEPPASDREAWRGKGREKGCSMKCFFVFFPEQTEVRSDCRRSRPTRAKVPPPKR